MRTSLTSSSILDKHGFECDTFQWAKNESYFADSIVERKRDVSEKLRPLFFCISLFDCLLACMIEGEIPALMSHSERIRGHTAHAVSRCKLPPIMQITGHSFGGWVCQKSAAR